MTLNFIIPSKMQAYLRRLELEYQRTENDRLRRIILSSRHYVREGVGYDNWNGGTYSHEVVLFLPSAVLGNIGLDQQDQIAGEICDALRSCAGALDNEHIGAVHIELEDENDPEFQQSLALANRTQPEPETIPFWKPGYLRLFVSHRDGHKRAAKELAEALDAYGISAFVAHDTIQPMTSWQNEIVKGLQTMEVMLAFITDDFHDSTWTNQEIGYALGKGIPIISLKLEKKDPSGFIGSEQALRGRLDDVNGSVAGLIQLLAEKVGQKSRLQATLISAFANSPDFSEAKARFERMRRVVTKLTDAEFSQIVEAYSGNSQLYNAHYLDNQYNRLKDFLEKASGKSIKIEGRKIVDLSAPADDEIPF